MEMDESIDKPAISGRLIYPTAGAGMKFDVVKSLARAENALVKRIDAASIAISGDDSMARAFRAGRHVRRNAGWHEFLMFARPINEAAMHIADERRALEGRLEREITSAVANLKRRR